MPAVVAVEEGVQPCHRDAEEDDLGEGSPSGSAARCDGVKAGVASEEMD